MPSNSQKTSKKIGLSSETESLTDDCTNASNSGQAFSISKFLLEKIYQLFIIPIVNKNLYNFIDMNGKKGGIVKKSGGVIFDGENFFVVKRNKYNDISLPKGHVDPRENSEQAALREVLEETGFECKIMENLGFVEYLNPEGIVQVQFFAMSVNKKVSEELFPDVDEVIAGNYNKIERLLSYSTDKKILEKGAKFFKCIK